MDLRIESGGITGSTSSFLALPALADDVPATVAWSGRSSAGDRSLTLIDLGALHVMSGDVSILNSGEVTTYWLSSPTFDVESFTRHAAKMHAGLARHFSTNPRPLRIFLRHNPYRGMSGSALPDCFIAGWHENAVQQPERLTTFVDHELVHNWVGLTGEDAVWFNEGLADYYAMVLPHRLELLGTEAFLERADEITRRCLASKWRDTSLKDAALAYWTDPRAHDVAYVRGVLYFAELSRLLRAQGGPQLDDLVGRVHQRFAEGSPAKVVDWLTWVQDVLGPASAALHERVMEGNRPAPEGDLWQTGKEPALVEVPVIEPGFAFSTYLTHVVAELAPGGPAAAAGLREGDELIDLPRYGELVGYPANRPLTVTARRGTRLNEHTMALGRQTVTIPQWSHAARHGPLPTVR